MKKQNLKSFIAISISFAICLTTFNSFGAVIYSPGALQNAGFSPANDPALNINLTPNVSTDISEENARVISQIVVQNNNNVLGSNINATPTPNTNSNYQVGIAPSSNTNTQNNILNTLNSNFPTYNNSVINTVATNSNIISNPISNNTIEAPIELNASAMKEVKTSSKMPVLSAPAYIVANTTNKHIYASKDLHTKYEPAGLANLMTAYLAMQYFTLDKVLKVNGTAVHGVDKDASIAALNEGDTITLKDAIISMFVKGCVDSANVIAENVSGSIDEFVKLMNENAKDLGLTDTYFANPSGINNPSQQTSPLDMAVIMGKVCENEELVKLMKITQYTLPPARRREKLTLYSKNSQLIETNSTYNPDLECSRLGYNEKARYCVASMANHKGNNIVVIILKANGSQFSDTKKLIDYGRLACEEDINN